MAESGLGLSYRWRLWRNRLLASESFQSWASRFLLTRPIARRSARRLFDLVAGFVYSQVLYSCVKLDLFNRLAAEGSSSVAELARLSELNEEAMSTLLRAAASLDLVEAAGSDRYCLGFLGAPLAGNPGLQALIVHHEKLYDDLGDPLALLRDKAGQGALASYWAYATTEQPSVLAAAKIEEYTRLMGASQHLVASELLQAYDLSRHRRLLDIGGGNGAFCSCCCGPPSRTRTCGLRFARGGRDGARQICPRRPDKRAQVAYGGDFLRDPLPEGADVDYLAACVARSRR